MLFHGGRNLLPLIWVEHPGDGKRKEEVDAKLLLPTAVLSYILKG
jgi:hypothetical protein